MKENIPIHVGVTPTMALIPKWTGQLVHVKTGILVSTSAVIESPTVDTARQHLQMSLEGHNPLYAVGLMLGVLRLDVKQASPLTPSTASRN